MSKWNWERSKTVFKPVAFVLFLLYLFRGFFIVADEPTALVAAVTLINAVVNAAIVAALLVFFVEMMCAWAGVD